LEITVMTDKFVKFIPKSTSTILSATFFVATLLVNYGASRTHISDVQAQQEKRLDAIEAQIKNDLATRREVDEVKATVNRIEDKLDQALSNQHSAFSPNNKNNRKNLATD